MWFQKYMASRYSRSELDKLEKTHKFELRMISTAASKFKSKFMKIEDTRSFRGETEACTLRMYETHFPGFCYLRDGRYRKKVANLDKKIADSIESSEKIKVLLFTDNELDIQKVLCLHLLGTHVQNRRHIQRKDGRLCTFAKSQSHANKRFSLQSLSRRTSNNEDLLSVYDKILPRYVLDISVTDHYSSNVSLQTYEKDTDDESGKKRLLQVPIYINNDIRAIVSSVIEALEAVSSSKLEELLAMARNPEELVNLLGTEKIQELMTELAHSQLVNNSTAYSFIMTHPTFEKDSSTTETVAQVLEIAPDAGMRNMLNLIRKSICHRYNELVLFNVLPGKKKRTESVKRNILWNISRTSFLSGDTSTKTYSSGFTEHDSSFHVVVINEGKIEKNSNLSIRKGRQKKDENSSNTSDSRIDTRIQQSARFHEGELNKYDLKSLNNSQRILLGLKVASMKNKPINMHQFENKKQVNMISLITSVIKSDITHNNSVIGDNSFSLDQRRDEKTFNRISSSQIQGLENLTRGILSNFRHDIATTENKIRVKEFIQAPL